MRVASSLIICICLLLPNQKAALGHWVFKSKSSQNSTSPRVACKGCIFAMEVTEELESWPEQETHNRRWVSIHTSSISARRLCISHRVTVVRQKLA